ncbi:metallophosphatase [Betaproteobacteria bacterium]|nr:metallophosphatase [Betaproteobacteria bacterium]
MYDLIGDIHGQADRLFALLEKMGYTQGDGVWRHETRKAVFLGDFIDRGEKQIEVLTTAKAMIDTCNAYCVMGNHELNAIGWHTPAPYGKGFLRPHTENNRRQHAAFLAALGENSSKHQQWIEWFKTLPLWLELDGIRVIHACWDEAAMQILSPCLNVKHIVLENAWPRLFVYGSAEFKASELLLKGEELDLPEGFSFRDKDDHSRRRARVKWWLSGTVDWRELAVEKEIARQLPAIPAARNGRGYPVDAPPAFVGHYWRTGEPEFFAPNIACVDYSAPDPTCKLVAYRWQGEARLRAEHFVTAE